MKKCLIVGLNTYHHVGQLAGCTNDALYMKKLFSQTLNYDEVISSGFIDPNHLKKDLLLGTLQQLLVTDADEKDPIRVFYFSGHGDWLPEQEPKEQPNAFDEMLDEEDGTDEVICLPHYHWNDKDSYILDDEIGVIVKQALRQPNPPLPIFIMDCCYAGDNTRTGRTVIEQEGLRRMKFKDAPLSLTDPLISRFAKSRTPSHRLDDNFTQTNRFGSCGNKHVDKYDHILLSACNSCQQALEGKIMGTSRGFFTYALEQSMLECPTDFEDLYERILKQFSNKYLQQSPQLYSNRKLKQRFF